MKSNVTARYFLLYSTVQTFSPCRGWRKCRRNPSSTSSSVSCLTDRPSRNWAGHHDAWGRVRLDRVATDWRVEADEEVPFAAEMTLEPKNLRSSASLSRCWTETERRAASERAVAGDDAGPLEDASWGFRSGYLTESSASALSTSSSSSSSFCFCFAFCFLRALRSFFDGPAGVEGTESSTSCGGSGERPSGSGEDVVAGVLLVFFFFFFYCVASDLENEMRQEIGLTNLL